MKYEHSSTPLICAFDTLLFSETTWLSILNIYLATLLALTIVGVVF